VTYAREASCIAPGARAALSRLAGWANRHTIADLPREIRAAYEDFQYAPAMSVNVAPHQLAIPSLFKLTTPGSFTILSYAEARVFSEDMWSVCNRYIAKTMGAGSVASGQALRPDKYQD